MTLHREYKGETIDLEDYELATYYEKPIDESSKEQIRKDEVEYIFECDRCGEMKEHEEVCGMRPDTHICKKHLPDDVVETLE